MAARSLARGCRPSWSSALRRTESLFRRPTSGPFLILLALSPAWLSCTDDPSFTPAPEPGRDYGMIDSCSLAARSLAAERSTTVWIDLDLAFEIEQVLQETTPLRPEFGALRVCVPHSLGSIILGTSPELSEAWSRGELLVGDPYLDSLATTLGLKEVRSIFENWWSVQFAVSLNTPLVAEAYKRSPLVWSAEPSGFGGDGDRIWAFEKDDTWHVIYSEGRGDCLSGCIWHSFFYVEWSPSAGGTVVEDLVPGATLPRWHIYRWNIPGRYHAAGFGSIDSLLTVYEDETWWVRRHAVEATWRFFAYASAPFSDDRGSVWQDMRAEALLRRDEIVERIQALLVDPDADVRASAALALEEIGD